MTRAAQLYRGISNRTSTATIESEDEIAEQIPQHRRKSKQHKRSAHRALANGPQSAAMRALEALSDAEAALQEMIDDDEYPDEDIRQELQERLLTVSHLVQRDSISADFSQSKENPKLDKLYVHWGKKDITFLQPVDRIGGTATFNINKTVACYRLKDDSLPRAYAFSGDTPCTTYHPNVLDAGHWKEQIRLFGDNYEHKFRSNGWDGSGKSKERGCRIGDGFACHSEKQVMLAAAFHLLDTLLIPRFRNKKASVRRLYLLRSVKDEHKSIIVDVSDHPCGDCKAFQEVLELITGINFKCNVTINVAAIKKQKPLNKKQRIFPKLDSDGFVIDHSRELADLQTIQNDMQKKSNMIVLVPPNPTILDTSPVPKPPKPSSFTHVAMAVRSRPGPSVANPITPEKTTFTAPAVNMSSRKRGYFDEDDEYFPATPVSRHATSSPSKKRALAAKDRATRRAQAEQAERELDEDEDLLTTSVVRQETTREISKWRYRK